jgi:DNA-directed RNA polymerase subunit M/transcription elongation factor TFIIS
MPFLGDWKPTKPENPDFKCRKCDSDNVWYRRWESSDEAHEDVKYECRNCGRTWWVEGPDY